MLTVHSEEYICYSENTVGQYSPLIGVVKYDGNLFFRDVVKADLARIPDDEILSGSWIFRKTMNNNGTWVKRFAILRGGFIFLFHSPQNEKPLAVIPLDGCRLVLPQNNEKAFDDLQSPILRMYVANEGYEFDIRHVSRPTVRLYAISDFERIEWIRAATKRSNLPSNIQDMYALQNALRKLPQGSNITLSQQRLEGLTYTQEELLQATLETAGNTMTRTGSMRSTTSNSQFQFSSNNPFVPPGLMQEGDEVKDSLDDLATSGIGQGGHELGIPQPPIAGGHGRTASTVSVRSAATSQTAGTTMHTATSVAVSAQGGEQQLMTTGSTAASSSHLSLRELGGGTGGAAPSVTSNHSINTTHLEESLKLRQSEQLEARDREARHRSTVFSPEMIQLARNIELETPMTLAMLFRQALYFYDEELAEDPTTTSTTTNMSKTNVMTATKLATNSATNSVMATNKGKQSGPAQQQQSRQGQGGQSQSQGIPYVKGHASEDMLLQVYRHYCLPGDLMAGYMSLEQLVVFLQDSGLLVTHVPHDDNDLPIEEYKEALDVLTLLRLIPGRYGASYSQIHGTGAAGGAGSTAANTMYNKGLPHPPPPPPAISYFNPLTNDPKILAVLSSDRFIIDFGQFYSLLLYITSIVYPELYRDDNTVAFSRLLYEVILPLACWTKDGHNKHGSVDPLVSEERILLVCITYASNLWKVFLSYACDATGAHVPEINAGIGRDFPEAAKINERGMYGTPWYLPDHTNSIGGKALPSTMNQDNSGKPASSQQPDSWFISETGCLRFARDFGLAPTIVSLGEVRKMVRQIHTTATMVGAGGSIGGGKVGGGIKGQGKVIVSARLPSREMLFSSTNAGAGTGGGAAAVKKTSPSKSNKAFTFGSTMNKPLSPSKAAQAAAANNNTSFKAKLAAAGAAADDDDVPPPPPPLADGDEEDGQDQPTTSKVTTAGSNPVTGLGYSEFVELICRIAVSGLATIPQFDVLFPTPFAKVLAVLTVWGVADMEKLEEVRVIRTDEVY